MLTPSGFHTTWKKFLLPLQTTVCGSLLFYPRWALTSSLAVPDGACTFEPMETQAPTHAQDTAIFDLIQREKERQTHGIKLIASENYVSEQVMRAQGSS